MTKLEQEDKLYDELQDIRFDMMEDVNNLINAKWDSPTLKENIKNYLVNTWRVHKKIDALNESKEKKK